MIKRYLGVIILAILFFGFIYFLVASTAWRWRNPKANQVTVITYFSDAMHFRKLEGFQYE